MSQQSDNQEVPPGAVSGLNPQGGGLYQFTPEDEAIVNSYAKQRGISQSQAVRALLQHRQGTTQAQASQPSVLERTLDTIGQAQALGVASTDPNDVINSMGKGLVIKNLAKGLNDGDGNNKKTSSFDDIKEMMYLKIMGNMAGVNDNNQGSSSDVKEMKSENDKLRQELKDSEAKRQQEQKDAEARRQADMEKLEGKMRDMLFEKKIEKLEEKAAAAQTSVTQELKNLSDKFELYGRIPQTASAPEKKDAVSELEEIGGKLERIKKALAPIFPQALAPVAPGLSTPASPPPSLKNADGSTDYLAAVERIGGIVVKGIEALGKKPPAGAEAAAQPAQPATQQAYTERRMGLDEYADYLLSLKERNPEQQQWLINYQAHLEREQAKMRVTEKPVQQSTELPAVQPYRAPAEQPADPYTPDAIIGDGQTPGQEQPGQTDAGQGSIEQPADAGSPSGQPIEEQPGGQPAEEIVEQPPEQPAEEDTDVVKKLQKAEAERMKRLQGVV